MKTTRLTALVLSAVFFASCEKETTTENTTTDLPTTYNFENVSYSGQTNRLDMLFEIIDYAKTANSGAEISAMQLQDMFSNANYTWAQNDLNSSTKQLADKIADGEQSTMGAFFNDLENASKSKTPGQNGTSGLVTSNNGAKTYLFDSNGHEPIQFIEKVSMGVVFMNQITNVYLTDGKMNVDNETVEPGKGTAMQHHWDEAFGYWGVPINFGTDGFIFEKEAAYDRFWGKYTNGRNALLQSNAKLMQAFIKGRAAINTKDYTTRDAAITDINREFSLVQAGTAIHYLNSANANIGDDALRNHALSEGLAFAYGLQFNKQNGLTESEFETIFDDAFENFYEITSAEMTAAIDALATKYNLNDVKASL